MPSGVSVRSTISMARSCHEPPIQGRSPLEQQDVVLVDLRGELPAGAGEIREQLHEALANAVLATANDAVEAISTSP